MMNPIPRVSIVVPAYNHRPFLEARLNSVLSQTFQDFELILLDDASPDGSAEFLKSYAHLPRTRLILNQNNLGSPFVQWNRGVQEASGEFVWIAESDDVAEPVFLETLVKVLDEHPGVGLVYCESIRIDATGNSLGTPKRTPPGVAPSRWDSDFISSGVDEIRKVLYFENVIISASAVVFRRQVYLDAGPAAVNLSLSGDWLQWCRMLVDTDVAFIAQPLNSTRIHANTQRSFLSEDGTLELESLLVQHHIRRVIELNRDQIRTGAKRVALSWTQSLRAGRYNGRLINHFIVLKRILQADLIVGFEFASYLPYSMIVWLAKNVCFRNRRG